MGSLNAPPRPPPSLYYRAQHNITVHNTPQQHTTVHNTTPARRWKLNSQQERGFLELIATNPNKIAQILVSRKRYFQSPILDSEEEEKLNTNTPKHQNGLRNNLLPLNVIFWPLLQRQIQLSPNFEMNQF